MLSKSLFLGHKSLVSKTIMLLSLSSRQTSLFSTDAKTDAEKMKESIRRAAESAQGRPVVSPPRKPKDKTGNAFYSVNDYNPEFRKVLKRQNMLKSDKEFRFAIVGTGPAGFYMAKNLLKSVEKCRIDLIDRNPHPFGLIRTGVAPDHQAMKRIENDFSQVLDDDRCQFFGNVFVNGNKGIEDWAQNMVTERGHWTVGIDELRQNYSAVILAYGAASDRELGLEGEHTI